MASILRQCLARPDLGQTVTRNLRLEESEM
jgi:hypothetical protein